jgi:hypothetical protein
MNFKKRNVINKYLLPMGVCASIISISFICEAAAGSSVGVIQTVIQNITTLIKTDGKVGLQILSAAAGGIAAAKTVSWQPLLVGAGGAGVLEMIFQAIG